MQQWLWSHSLQRVFSCVVLGAFVLSTSLVQSAEPEDSARESVTAQPQSVRGAAELSATETAGRTRVYGIGSISKIFPAVAVMQLVEQGKLDLDAPLTQYIPEFFMADSRYTEITPRMLLDHSSGLMGTSDHNAMLLGEISTYYHDTLLEQLRTQRLKADPGAYSVYSNDGFTLAELLVERVSGESFTQYIQNHISTPLGMAHTVTPNNDYDRSQQAAGYGTGGAIRLPPESLNAIGAGGILSTAEDLCRFAQIFTKQGTGVLTAQSVGEMGTPQTNNPLFEQQGDSQWNYGLGWDDVSAAPFSYGGVKAVTKGGDSKVYHGNLTILPEENMSAAVLSSSGGSDSCQLMANGLLLQALQAAGKRLDYHFPLQPEAATQTDSRLMEQYEGYYLSQGLIKVRFSEEGALYLSTLDQRRNVTQEYLPAGDGQFVSTNGSYINSGGELVSAESGMKGKTTITFRQGTNGERYLCVDGFESHPGLGQAGYTLPFAQKVEPITPENSVQKAWEARNGKKYYLISEKASSSGYLSPATTVRLPKEGEGYFRNARIIDAERAKSLIQLPIMFGRDLLDFRFYTEGQMQYMEELNGGDGEQALKRRYLCEDDIPALPDQAASYRIPDATACMWFSIPQAMAGAEFSVTVANGGAYFVYDASDRLIATSITPNAPKSFRLPTGGKLALAGSGGDSFELRY